MKLYNNKNESKRVKIQLEFEYSLLLGTVKESLGVLALETGLRTVQLLMEMKLEISQARKANMTHNEQHIDMEQKRRVL